MALTKEEQAELDALKVKENAPEPRTEDGLPGLLHALIDSVSGTVAHRGAEVWLELHRAAEDLAGAKAAPKQEKSSSSAPSSSGSSGAKPS